MKKLKFIFFEFKNPNPETKNEIKNTISFLKNKNQVFKEIETRIENNIEKKSSCLWKTKSDKCCTKEITIFTDFDGAKSEISIETENLNEYFFEKDVTEQKIKYSGEKKITEYWQYKNIKNTYREKKDKFIKN